MPNELSAATKTKLEMVQRLERIELKLDVMAAAQAADVASGMHIEADLVGDGSALRAIGSYSVAVGGPSKGKPNR